MMVRSQTVLVVPNSLTETLVALRGETERRQALAVSVSHVVGIDG